MAQDIKVNLPSTTEPYKVLTQLGFKRGVITLVDESNLPKDALKEAQNIMLVEDGAPAIRWGSNWYGTAASASVIDGAAMFVTSAGAVHLVKVAGGTVYRSTDNGTTWNTCTGATFTSGYKVDFEHIASYLFMGNGFDNIMRYDGTTTLQPYTAIATPAVPTAVESGGAGMGGATYNHYYKVSAVNSVGFTVASAASTVFQTLIPRSAFDAVTNYATLTTSNVAGATRYDWFYSSNGTDYSYLASTGTFVYTDAGNEIEQASITPPTTGTTNGPKLGDISYVGGRLWGTKDYDNKYRAWWSGSGAFVSYFSSAYDGGWIDLQKGSQYTPIHVDDYRDGRGTSLATIWCDSVDNKGCIWQVSLDTATVGDYSYTSPSAFKLPGSRGTSAQYSVVNVLNDFLFYNTQAIYNIGNRVNLQQILSTDEISANIRPTVKTITPTAASKIAAAYYDAKVFISAPYGSSANNTITVYDTERKAWIPQAFTFGVERFFAYTDTSGTPHLLCWKPNDTKLTEISKDIQGDYGVAFATSLVTGLNYVSKNRFEFMWVEEGEVEFSQPKSTINIELLGIERNRGYRSLKSTSIVARTSNVGWSSFAWGTLPWTDSSVVPSTYSESSIKRYFNVQRELNAYQYRITSEAIDASYTLRVLQINGTITNSGKPRSWRI
jgi:hypothetical protein